MTQQEDKSRKKIYNHYKKEDLLWLSQNAQFYNAWELVEIFKELGYDMSLEKMHNFLSKRKIRAKNFSKSNVRKVDEKPIGSERIKDGKVVVKTRNKKWVYKNRYLYEKYNDEKLKNNDVVIFLDNNKDNFSKDNLVKISKSESNIMTRNNLRSDDKNLNETGVLIAKLRKKINDLNKSRK